MNNSGAWKVTPWLGVHIASAEDPSSVLSTIRQGTGKNKRTFLFFLKGVLVNNDLFGAGSHAVCPTELDSEEVVET